jgi:16S rRNA (guanine966-N2)-methyltransferase
VRIVGGTWRGRRLVDVPDDRIRPTSDRVREAWMSAMGGRFDRLEVLDLFAGTGALGLECLSRGAEHVTFVESSQASLDVLRGNLDLLGADPDRVRIVHADAIAWLEASAPARPRPGLAVADPPYDGGWHEALVDRFESRPFAHELWVEHRSSAVVDSPWVRRTRTYGGTAITTLTPPPDTGDTDA